MDVLLRASGDWKGIGRSIYEWISFHWKKLSFESVFQQVMTNIEIPDILVYICGWCINRGFDNLVTHVVGKNNSNVFYIFLI